MGLILLVGVWNWVAIPYFIFMIIQELFPTIPSTWGTFGYILLLLILIRGRGNLAVKYKMPENEK